MTEYGLENCKLASTLGWQKLQTFKLANKAEALKSLGTPIKPLKTLLHATDKLSRTVLL